MPLVYGLSDLSLIGMVSNLFFASNIPPKNGNPYVVDKRQPNAMSCSS